MNKRSKIIISILLLIIAILSISLAIVLNKNTNITKTGEEKEQLTTEDGLISTKDHLAQMSTLENVIETEDNWKLWAQKAGITIANYANINELLSDTTAVTNLSNSTAAVDYMMTSQDTNNCIRQKILDNNNVMIIMLKSSYAKSKILENDDWRTMILARTSLIDSIISNNLHTTISTANSVKSYETKNTSITSNFTLNENEFVLKGVSYLSFIQGGGSYRSIYLNINGKSIAANSGTDYLLSYNGGNIQASAYNKDIKVTSAYAYGGAQVSFNASSQSYNEMKVSGTLYVLR